MNVQKQEHPSVFKSPAAKQKILDFFAQVLGGYNFAFRETTVDTSYGLTYALQAGSPEDPALVLLHGSSSNSAMWLVDMAVLSVRYHVLAVDIIGEAGHSAEVRLDLQGNAYAGWLAEVLDGYGIRSAAFMGNSLGGWLALNFAVAYPERTRALVLLASAGITPTRPSFLLRAAWSQIRGPRGFDALYRKLFNNNPIPPEVTAFMQAVMEGFLPMMERLPEYDDVSLRRLNMPVLFIGGAKDIIVDVPGSAHRLLNLVPKASVHVLDDVGHVIYNVLDKILPFLEEGLDLPEANADVGRC